MSKKEYFEDEWNDLGLWIGRVSAAQNRFYAVPRGDMESPRYIVISTYNLRRLRMAFLKASRANLRTIESDPNWPDGMGGMTFAVVPVEGDLLEVR